MDSKKLILLTCPYTQSNLQTQCNPFLNPNDIFHRNIKILKLVLNHKELLVAKANLRRKDEAKDSLFDIWCWENCTDTMQKNQTGPLSYTIYKNHLKMD